MKGRAVPAVASGLVDAERHVLQSRDLLNAQGQITPWVIPMEALDTPEKLLTSGRWNDIYGVPAGEITIERIQHAFYMAANYGFQILNGNFAAAIDDYELSLRFMNDLATYRIDVSWLWSLLHHEAAVAGLDEALRELEEAVPRLLALGRIEEHEDLVHPGRLQHLGRHGDG